MSADVPRPPTDSIAIDLVGDGSFIIPGAGEGTDLLWAPISALLVRALYGNNVLAIVNLIEELLPFTDIIPTATLAFILELASTGLDKGGGLGADGNSRGGGGSVVDVKSVVVEEEEEGRTVRDRPPR